MLVERAKRHIQDKGRSRNPDVVDGNWRTLTLKHPIQHGILAAHVAISRHKRDRRLAEETVKDLCAPAPRARREIKSSPKLRIHCSRDKQLVKSTKGIRDTATPFKKGDQHVRIDNCGIHFQSASSPLEK